MSESTPASSASWVPTDEFVTAPNEGLILDLFAGPGGWSEGLRMLGLTDIGIEWDDAACRTRMAAGHTATIRADVATYPTDPFVGKVTGLIASPPCQDFSLAGLQKGMGGDKGKLVTEVLRWTRDLMPRWVACEQVPTVEPIWKWFAHEMRGWGYRTYVGTLNTADYGVPQTRERALLLASLDGPVVPPEPTHARIPDECDMFGGSRQRWVAIREVLPYLTADVELHHERGAGLIERHGERPGRRVDEPSFCVMAGSQGSGTRMRWIRMGNHVGATVRSIEEPAPTVLFGHRANAVEWHDERPPTRVELEAAGVGAAASGEVVGARRVTVEEAAILQSFRDGYPWQGSKTKRYEQVGNAVPPLFAAHVLSSVTGIRLLEDAAA